MKRIPFLPIADEKLLAYGRGELKLAYSRIKKSYHFFKAKPKGTTIDSRRRMYWRMWVLKRKGLLVAADRMNSLLSNMHEPVTTRHTSAATSHTAAVVKLRSAIRRKLTRIGQLRKKSLAVRKAFRKGYNKAFSKKHREIQALQSQLSLLKKTKTATPTYVRTPNEDATWVEEGLFSRIKSAILG